MSLEFINFDITNRIHIEVLKNMAKDPEITKRFNGFLNHLNKKTSDIFDKGFWVCLEGVIVGYIDIGNYNKDENCVYLRGAIFKEYRNKHIGTDMLRSACEFIFKGYPYIGKIKLKIADDNYASLKVADHCGFQWERDDFYYLDNPYYEKPPTLH